MMCIVVQNVNPWDESGVWSILTDTLQYVKAEVDSSVTYSFDQKRYQNSKSRYFDGKSDDFSDKNTSIDKFTMQRRKTLMLQITMYLMYQYIHSTCFQNLWKIDMEICLHSQCHTSNLMKVSVQPMSGQKIIIVPLWKVRLMT